MLKYAPIRTEFLQATVSDEAVIKTDDNFELQAEYETVEQERVEQSNDLLLEG